MIRSIPSFKRGGKGALVTGARVNGYPRAWPSVQTDSGCVSTNCRVQGKNCWAGSRLQPSLASPLGWPLDVPGDPTVEVFSPDQNPAAQPHDRGSVACGEQIAKLAKANPG